MKFTVVSRLGAAFRRRRKVAPRRETRRQHSFLDFLVSSLDDFLKHQ
jgi:hypothetical protein